MTQGPKRAWRVMIFTSGEVSIREHMAQAGVETKLGQEVRLLEISADARAGMGLFENCHGKRPAEFANQIKRVTGQYYGTVLREWLNILVGDPSVKPTLLTTIQKFKELVLADCRISVAPRAAQRFGCVAAAGEIATAHGLTGWKKGQATEAAKTCFDSWAEVMRTVDPVLRDVELVKAFVINNEKNFLPPDSPLKPTVGYRKKANFLISPDAFRDAVGADKYLKVAQSLERAGVLVAGGKNRLQRLERIAGALKYYFVVKDSIRA